MNRKISRFTLLGSWLIGLKSFYRLADSSFRAGHDGNARPRLSGDRIGKTTRLIRGDASPRQP